MAYSSLDLSSNVYIFSLFCLISKHGTESSGYIRTKREREDEEVIEAKPTPSYRHTFRLSFLFSRRERERKVLSIP